MVDISKVQNIVTKELYPKLKTLTTQKFGNTYKLIGNASSYAYEPQVMKKLTKLHVTNFKIKSSELIEKSISKEAVGLTSDVDEAKLSNFIDYALKNKNARIKLQKKSENLIIDLKKSGLSDDEITFELSKRTLAEKIASEKIDTFCPNEAALIKSNLIDVNLELMPDRFAEAVYKVEDVMKELQNKFNEFFNHFKIG